MKLTLAQRLGIEPVPLAPSFDETLGAWLARHPGEAYRQALDAELAVWAEDEASVATVMMGAAVAQARDAGALLVPAHRTAESLVLYAIGATGIDPIRARMVAATDRLVNRKHLLWFAGDHHAGIPCALTWQLAAADVLWPDERPWSVEAWDADAAELLVGNWSDDFPTMPPPATLPASWCELAAMFALCSPLGEARGLRRVYDGLATDLVPLAHAAFAETRGWPVFADDVLAWLHDVGGCTPADAEASLRQLRFEDPVALSWLPGDYCETVRTLRAFGPRLTPRSVSLSQAMLAVVGARSLHANRALALEIKQAFNQQED